MKNRFIAICIMGLVTFVVQTTELVTELPHEVITADSKPESHRTVSVSTAEKPPAYTPADRVPNWRNTQLKREPFSPDPIDMTKQFLRAINLHGNGSNGRAKTLFPITTGGLDDNGAYIPGPFDGIEKGSPTVWQMLKKAPRQAWDNYLESIRGTPTTDFQPKYTAIQGNRSTPPETITESDKENTLPPAYTDLQNQADTKPSAPEKESLAPDDFATVEKPSNTQTKPDQTDIEKPKTFKDFANSVKQAAQSKIQQTKKLIQEKWNDYKQGVRGKPAIVKPEEIVTAQKPLFTKIADQQKQDRQQKLSQTLKYLQTINDMGSYLDTYTQQQGMEWRDALGYDSNKGIKENVSRALTNVGTVAVSKLVAGSDPKVTHYALGFVGLPIFIEAMKTSAKISKSSIPKTLLRGSGAEFTFGPLTSILITMMNTLKTGDANEIANFDRLINTVKPILSSIANFKIAGLFNEYFSPAFTDKSEDGQLRIIDQIMTMDDPAPLLEGYLNDPTDAESILSAIKRNRNIEAYMHGFSFFIIHNDLFVQSGGSIEKAQALISEYNKTATEDAQLNAQQIAIGWDMVQTVSKKMPSMRVIRIATSLLDTARNVVGLFTRKNYKQYVCKTATELFNRIKKSPVFKLVTSKAWEYGIKIFNSSLKTVKYFKTQFSKDILASKNYLANIPRETLNKTTTFFADLIPQGMKDFWTPSARSQPATLTLAYRQVQSSVTLLRKELGLDEKTRISDILVKAITSPESISLSSKDIIDSLENLITSESPDENNIETARKFVPENLLKAVLNFASKTPELGSEDEAPKTADELNQAKRRICSVILLDHLLQLQKTSPETYVALSEEKIGQMIDSMVSFINDKVAAENETLTGKARSGLYNALAPTETDPNENDNTDNTQEENLEEEETDTQDDQNNNGDNDETDQNSGSEKPKGIWNNVKAGFNATITGLKNTPALIKGALTKTTDTLKTGARTTLEFGKAGVYAIAQATGAAVSPLEQIANIALSNDFDTFIQKTIVPEITQAATARPFTILPRTVPNSLNVPRTQQESSTDIFLDAATESLTSEELSHVEPDLARLIRGIINMTPLQSDDFTSTMEQKKNPIKKFFSSLFGKNKKDPVETYTGEMIDTFSNLSNIIPEVLEHNKNDFLKFINATRATAQLTQQAAFQQLSAEVANSSPLQEGSQAELAKALASGDKNAINAALQGVSNDDPLRIKIQYYIDLPTRTETSLYFLSHYREISGQLKLQNVNDDDLVKNIYETATFLDRKETTETQIREMLPTFKKYHSYFTKFPKLKPKITLSQRLSNYLRTMAGKTPRDYTTDTVRSAEDFATKVQATPAISQLPLKVTVYNQETVLSQFMELTATSSPEPLAQVISQETKAVPNAIALVTGLQQTLTSIKSENSVVDLFTQALASNEYYSFESTTKEFEALSLSPSTTDEHIISAITANFSSSILMNDSVRMEFSQKIVCGAKIASVLAGMDDQASVQMLEAAEFTNIVDAVTNQIKGTSTLTQFAQQLSKVSDKTILDLVNEALSRKDNLTLNTSGDGSNELLNDGTTPHKSTSNKANNDDTEEDEFHDAPETPPYDGSHHTQQQLEQEEEQQQEEEVELEHEHQLQATEEHEQFEDALENPQPDTDGAEPVH